MAWQSLGGYDDWKVPYPCACSAPGSNLEGALGQTELLDFFCLSVIYVYI